MGWGTPAPFLAPRRGLQPGWGPARIAAARPPPERCPMRPRLAIAPWLLAAVAAGADFPRFEAREIDPHAGEIVYAVTTADVDGDGKPDVVAVTEDAVLWYQNPTWEKHV